MIDEESLHHEHHEHHDEHHEHHEQHEQQRHPLLQHSRSLPHHHHHHRKEPNIDRANFIQKAILQTFKSTAHLSNLLPTGTVLAFQLLSPIFSDQGNCDDAGKLLTKWLVSICCLSCFLSSFTDSYRDDKGEVRYGIVTFHGIWIIDGSMTVPPDQAREFRLKIIDFLHAFMSTMVFLAIALLDQNAVNCFYPTPSDETTEIVTAIPIGIGMIGSAFFLKFPTTRHGIGFPLSPR